MYRTCVRALPHRETAWRIADNATGTQGGPSRTRRTDPRSEGWQQTVCPHRTFFLPGTSSFRLPTSAELIGTEAPISPSIDAPTVLAFGTWTKVTG